MLKSHVEIVRLKKAIPSLKDNSCLMQLKLSGSCFRKLSNLPHLADPSIKNLGSACNATRLYYISYDLSQKTPFDFADAWIVNYSPPSRDWTFAKFVYYIINFGSSLDPIDKTLTS